MRTETQTATSASGARSRGPPPLSAEPIRQNSATTDSPAPNSSSSKENQPTAGKLSSKPVTTNSNRNPRSPCPLALSPLLANGNFPLRHGNRETSAKTRNSSPRTTPPDTPLQPGTLAEMRLMDRYETRMRRGYERAVENLTTSASAGITENFQTNPRIPANNSWP